MSSTTELYYPTTIAEATGEGDISTGLNPLPWGAHGIAFTAGSSSGTTVTKNIAFSDYNWVSGDQLVITGGTGITLGTYTIASKTNSNSIVLSTSPGTTGTNVTAYIKRPSLAGGILDYPLSLPGPNALPNYDFDHVCCYRPQDGLSNQQTKLLRVGGLKRVGDDVDIVTALATNTPDTLTAEFGARLTDFNQDGNGQYYRILAAFRNSGGQIGTSYNNAGLFVDGGLDDAGIYQYYLQPGALGATTIPVASVTSSFALNFALNHDTGDAGEACSLLAVNGFIVRLTRTIADSASPRGRGRGRQRWDGV